MKLVILAVLAILAVIVVVSIIKNKKDSSKTIEDSLSGPVTTVTIVNGPDGPELVEEGNLDEVKFYKITDDFEVSFSGHDLKKHFSNLAYLAKTYGDFYEAQYKILALNESYYHINNAILHNIIKTADRLTMLPNIGSYDGRFNILTDYYFVPCVHERNKAALMQELYKFGANWDMTPEMVDDVLDSCHKTDDE